MLESLVFEERNVMERNKKPPESEKNCAVFFGEYYEKAREFCLRSIERKNP